MARRSVSACLAFVLVFWGFSCRPAGAESVTDYSLLPPFVSSGVPPLVMLVLGRDHKLYYEAYNDISDLNGDGQLDIGYKPAIDYYGYFDSYKQYAYDSATGRFNPVASAPDKKISAPGRWSGDFLNYLTTSRMDALRKVLYGGYRSTDSATETVLQRAYIPQDAHTWGKEYESVARDGYDIRSYTPLALPQEGTRHLFASTTLSDNGTPLLRVLPNNPNRIWQWVAKERPVADDSLESNNLGRYDTFPQNAADFQSLVVSYGTASNQLGSQAVTRIDGRGNPFGAGFSPFDDNADGQNYFMTVFTGKITFATKGDYYFRADGDDAVEVLVKGKVVDGFYGGHSECGANTCSARNSSNSPYSGYYKVKNNNTTVSVEFHHMEHTGNSSYHLWYKGPDTGGQWQIVPDAKFSGLTQTVYTLDMPSSKITDYTVRVKVCDPSMPEDNCKRYPDGTYRPTGILQRHGESNNMYFGLITGSYVKNTSGGVLRKNIGSINDEINPSTGQFTATNGIVSTLNKLRIKGFDYGSHSYNENCGWIATRPINEGECRMWGNPVGEMMYEGLRYFAGKGSATTAFTYSGTSDDATLGLPLPSWTNPFDAGGGYPACSKPFMLVLSDINPSFDSNQLPGVDSNFGTFSGDLTGMNVKSLADEISLGEGIGGQYYIGQVGSTVDHGPTAKSVTTLGNIRGLAPEEPTKQGSYYSASVAYYGRTRDLNPADGIQNVTTYSVGLASPLPRIEIPVGGKTITLIPFAKSVGGYSISASSGSFQPTNTIVDVFIQELTPTHGTFRINFEDVEQGADHDMDAIAVYEYTVNADNTVTIKLTSEYAAGGIKQHMGYVISGTTADGTYLETRDADTRYDDVDYFLDTPPGALPGIGWNDGAGLPTDEWPVESATRTFSPGTTTAATLLKNPLWYAAKWGGFEEPAGVGNGKPDLQDEWDKDGDGVPDSYFYVTNPLRLEEQLNKSFAEILRRTASGTAASVISNSRSGEGAVYQSVFYPELKDQEGNTVNWIGQTHAFFVDRYGNMREDTNQNGQLDMIDDYIIEFSGQAVLKYADADGDGFLPESATPAGAPGSLKDIAYLWFTSDWLNSIADTDILNQRTYGSADKKRYIFTFADANRNMVPDAGEVVPFLSTQASILPYIHGVPPFDATLLPGELKTLQAADPAGFTAIWPDFLTRQRQRVVDFIRGRDQGTFTSATTPSYTIPEFRSRQLDYRNDGNVKTWRLGDIVYSSPTIVSTPQEDFDLLYKDASYTPFFRKYRNRRNMIYVGANDGMLHAFNGGFFDKSQNRFWKGSDSGGFNAAGPELGAEMWAYVPYNLLPHLYWLTDPSYDSKVHVAYMDLKPKIFDARIFFQSDGTTPLDDDHPNGWGTVMVCGMRFGGGALQADTNGDNAKAGEPLMTSAYVVMDITNPEVPPRLLAELSFLNEGIGFTTAYPAVATLRHRGDLVPAPASPVNDWYLVLGTGPASASGALGSALTDGASTRPARLLVVDLKKIASSAQVHVLNGSGTAVQWSSAAAQGAGIFATLDGSSFVSDLSSVDYDFDYKADVVYFGTVSGGYASGWGGKLRRLRIENRTDTTQWVGDSTLLDLNGVKTGGAKGQPVVAAPAVALSEHGDRWVYFGTGRFFNRNDVNNLSTASDPQSYYGIKEPYTLSSGVRTFTWAEVPYASLMNVSEIEVYEGGGTVKDPTGLSGLAQTNFLGLTSVFDAPVGDAKFKGGWYRDFSLVKERNLGQAALLGDVLTYATYLPSTDACEIEGNSYLHALYYKTGTAYKKPVIGYGTKIVMEDADGNGSAEKERKEIRLSTGASQGLITTPNIHVGGGSSSSAEGAETSIYGQASTGGIEKLGEDNPGVTRSGTKSWKEEN